MGFWVEFYQNVNILHGYTEHYNSKRPHQGRDQMVPMEYKPQLHGKVHKLSILVGLCQKFYEK